MSNTPPPAAPAPGEYSGNQQPYQQQPYQGNQQPYQGGYGQAPQEKWNVLAIVSFVGSLIGFSLIAAILGFVALSQIKKTGEKGRGLALAAVIIGIIATIFWILLIIIGVVAAMNAPDYVTY